MSDPPTSKLARDGGPPIRPQGSPDWPITDEKIEAAFADLLKTGNWGRYHGPHCGELIDALKRLHQREQAILTSSGTAAVELALRGMDVQPGDEVILAAYDFKANFTNILALGGVPVLVDVREDDWQMDVSGLEAAWSEKSKAVIATPLHGGCVNLKAVRQFCDERNLFLLEDICQCEGSLIQGRIAGTWGDASVMSFGGSKLLSAGRGGAIVSDNAEIVQRIKIHTQRGNEAYPLSEMQAAVLLPQLEQLAARNRTRLGAAEKLFSLLPEDCAINPLRVSLPETTPGYYKVGFQFDPESLPGFSRDAFSEAMIAEGFALHKGFRSLHLIHSERRFRAASNLTQADRADENIIVLHHPILLEDSDWQSDFVKAIEKVRSHCC